MESAPNTLQASRLRLQLASLTRRLRQETRASPVPFSHLVVLGTIDRLGSEVTPKAIADAERLRSSNVAATLRELEVAGYIQRSKDTFDKRRTRIVLTLQGRHVLNESRAQREQWLAYAMEACLNVEERLRLINAGQLLERLARFEGHPVSSLVNTERTHL